MADATPVQLERFAQQLEELGFEPLIAAEAARRFAGSQDVNAAIDFASSEQAARYAQREQQLELQRREEQAMQAEMEERALAELLKLGRYPERWCKAAVHIIDPTPRRCVQWIEEHRETLEQNLPTQDALARQRRSLATTSVRLPSTGIHRSKSESYGYSQSIVKDDDSRKKKGKIKFRHSVTCLLYTSPSPRDRG